MDSIFKDSAAPYVLALVVTGLGWLINSAIEELNTSIFIEYRITYETPTDTTPRIGVVTISNLSSAWLKVGKFGFECRPSGWLPNTVADCFEPLRKGLPESLFVRHSGATLAKQPQVVSKMHKTVPAFVPPRSDIGYRFGLADGAELLMQLDLRGVEEGADLNPKDYNVTLRNGWSTEGYVLRHFLTILTWTAAVFALLLAVWIVAAIAALRSGSSKPDQSDTETFTVTIGEIEHVAVVEKKK